MKNSTEFEFLDDFGSEEHKRHLSRMDKTERVAKQILYLEEEKYDVKDIREIFGYVPRSILIKSKTLMVQQYTKEKVLYKQQHRKPSWSELMFDLVFVSVFYKLGHTVEDNPSMDQVRSYMLKFSLLWLTWANATFIINMFVKSDVFERFFLIIMAAVVLGMGMNAFEMTGGSFLIYFLVGRLWTILCKIPFIKHQMEFRIYFILNILFSILPCILLFVVFIDKELYENLIILFIVLELAMYFLFNFIIKYIVKMKKVPAVSIHHAKDRIGLFTIVVLGEITFSLLIDSNSLNAFCIAVFGLVVASRIQYIYFKTESEGNAIEHVRGDNKTFAPFWFVLHLPLQCFIALSGSSLSIIVHDTAKIDEPNRSYFKNASNRTLSDIEVDFEFSKQLYFTCLSFIMGTLALMSLIHKKICGKEIKKEIENVYGCIILCIVFLVLAVVCRFVIIDVFVVSGTSALLMLTLSAVEEWKEAKSLWNKI
eukprot:NODE_727_length_4761_cov_0.252038.p1 type:complete len:481 gc:universal NODE_727_length_4761_cov_0.252038:3146-4588(+)